MTGNPDELNASPAALVGWLENLLYLNREYGIDVQDGFAQLLDKIECAGCSSAADALAFISLGNCLTNHAAAKCIDDPVLLINLLRVAQWYTGLGLSFLQAREARQARFVAAGTPTLQ